MRESATQRTRTYLTVDPIACDGHGVCAELLPEHIRLDPWGYPILDSDPLSRSLARQARRATSLCPRLALRLESRPNDHDPGGRG